MRCEHGMHLSSFLACIRKRETRLRQRVHFSRGEPTVQFAFTRLPRRLLGVGPLVLETIHPSFAKCKRQFAQLFDTALGFRMTEVAITFGQLSLTLTFNSAVFGSVRHSASAGRMSTPDLPSACSSNLCKRLSSCLLGQPGRSHAKLWPACRIFVLLFLEDLLRSLQNPKFWKTALVHFLCDR